MKATPDFAALRERLADAPCGQGYGQFVLGDELAYTEGDFAAARQYLRLFIKRTTGRSRRARGRLSAEIAHARRLLACAQAMRTAGKRGARLRPNPPAVIFVVSG